MVLDLSFSGGRVFGSGHDPVGGFGIQGACDSESGVVTWLKSYPGSHVVDYRGFAEAGSIWGTWVIPGTGTRGGFRIWPLNASEHGSEVATRTEEFERETSTPVRSEALTCVRNS